MTTRAEQQRWREYSQDDRLIRRKERVRFRFTGWAPGRCRRATGASKDHQGRQELPGQDLTRRRRGRELPGCYIDRRERTTREITGKDITAKDFRTWAGTVLAAMALNEIESVDTAAQAKRNLRAALKRSPRGSEHADDPPQMLHPSGSAEPHGPQSGHRVQVESRDRATERRGKVPSRRGRGARVAVRPSRRNRWRVRKAAGARA